MLRLVNTKLLIAILATLSLIAGLVYRNYQANAKAAAAAAALVEQQRKQQQEADALRKAVEEKRRKQNNNAGDSSKTWKSYVP